MKELWEQLVKLLKALPIPVRVIIIVGLLLTGLSFYLLREQTPGKLLLIPALVLVLTVIALTVFYRPRWTPGVAALLLLLWGGWCYAEVTKDRRQVRKLMEAGATLRREGNPQGSFQKYTEASQAAHNSKLVAEEMECLYELGDIKYLMSDYKNAKSYFDDCEQLAIQLNATEKKAFVFSRLGDIARFSGNTPLASRLLEEALKNFTLLQSVKGQAVVYRALGDVELKRNASLSRQYFEKAKELYDQVSDLLGQANALAGLADVSSLVGRTKEARERYQAALDIYKTLGADDGQGDVHRGMGDLDRRLGDLDKAEAHYASADGAYQKAQDKGGQADVYRGLGDCAQIRSITDNSLAGRARQKYELALGLFQEIGDVNGQAQVHLGLGEVELSVDKQAAKQHYRQAYNVYLDTGSKDGQGTSLRHFGDLEADEDQFDPARQHYNQAIDAYKQVDNKLGQAEVLKSLGDLETKLKKVDAARDNYSKALELYETAENLNGVAQIKKVLGDVELLASTKSPEKIKAARGYYESALKTYLETESKFGQAITLQSKAIVELKEKNSAAALQNFQKASNLYGDIGIAKPAALTGPATAGRANYENRLIHLANKM